jgi:hypothetical protein
MDQDAEADGRAEAGRAEAGLGDVGVEEGRRRHQPAGTLDLNPVDADTGLPAQRPDGDLGPTHLGAERPVLEPRDHLYNTHECELATGCAQRPIGQFCAPRDDSTAHQ